MMTKKKQGTVRMYRSENPSQDDGMIDPSIYRYGTLSRPGISDIVGGMWEAVSERRW
jgi:hypothetical protein